MEKCEKKYYKTKKTAKKYKKLFQNKYNKKLEIYKCPCCDGYHMTTDISLSKKVFFRKQKLINKDN